MIEEERKEFQSFGDYRKFLQDWRDGNVANVFGRTEVALIEMEERVKELEAENERLKKKGDMVVVGIDTDKKTLADLMIENERLKAELQQSATNCNKLKCLALHGMRDLFCVYMANEYFNLQDRKDEEGKARAKKLYEKFAHLRDKYKEAYRKARESLREGK